MEQIKATNFTVALVKGTCLLETQKFLQPLMYENVSKEIKKLVKQEWLTWLSNNLGDNIKFIKFTKLEDLCAIISPNED